MLCTGYGCTGYGTLNFLRALMTLPPMMKLVIKGSAVADSIAWVRYTFASPAPIFVFSFKGAIGAPPAVPSDLPGSPKHPTLSRSVDTIKVARAFVRQPAASALAGLLAPSVSPGLDCLDCLDLHYSKPKGEPVSEERYS